MLMHVMNIMLPKNFFYKKLEIAAIFDLTQKYGVMYCFDLNLRGKQN
jgi:hypothetical protein